MITTISAARDCDSVKALCELVNLPPFETTFAEAFAKFLDLMEEEVDSYYMPVPFDASTHPIQVGDTLQGIGEVQGIGYGVVFAGEPYLRYEARETKKTIYNGEHLMNLVERATKLGRLDKHQIEIICTYIEGCSDDLG